MSVDPPVKIGWDVRRWLSVLSSGHIPHPLLPIYTHIRDNSRFIYIGMADLNEERYGAKTDQAVAFHIAVYETVQQVPPGHVCTYGMPL